MNTILCPIQGQIEFPSCDVNEITPLLQHLQADVTVTQDTVFPRGTVTADGRLDLCKQSLGPQGCKLVTQALENNTQVASLLLGTDGIGDIGAEDVARLVERNSHLEVVYLGCNGIRESGAVTISQSLAHNQNVTGLWFKRNPIGDAGVRAVAGMLRQNQTLRVLDLVNTGMTLNGLEALVEVLCNENSTLERLYLGGNGLGPEAGELLTTLLQSNSRIRTLMFGVNNLGDKGVECLLQGLRDNFSLSELGLASNGITTAGAQIFTAVVAQHPSLAVLDLGWSPSTKVLGAIQNQVKDEGARYFGEMLRTNRVLTHLDLQSNGITRTGLEAIAAGLADNHVLQQLRLNCRLDEATKARLQSNRAASVVPAPPRDVAMIRSVYRTKVA